MIYLVYICKDMSIILKYILGETLFLPPRMAHAILNIEDNVSVTENYFLINSLEDLIHGVMMGEDALDPDNKTNEKLWKSLYYKLMTKDDRKSSRSMVEQIELMIENNPDYCFV